ncbi:MAG: peptidoglycan DD-metalloendopeptidase family protein [Aureispira sp.]
MKHQQFLQQLSNLSTSLIPIRASESPSKKYTKIDLSTAAKALEQLDLTNPTAMEIYIKGYCAQQGASVAYGGYLEERNLYKRSDHFNQEDASTERNIHLGVDFWAAKGTPVLAPLSGKIHSFQDNVGLGDYGPTILLAHELVGECFYSLYGHLNRTSLEGLVVGQTIKAGEVLAHLGGAEVNGDYAPHLHFQLIRDLEGKKGDYPGVCSQKDLPFYQQNCPDPALLFYFL